MKKLSKSISQIRMNKEKQEFVEQLKKTPVIQVVCEKLGVGRSTFYRWRDEDENFAKEVEESYTQGKLLINDLAISQLISSIKDKSIQGIKFWLQHNHPEYSNTMTLKHNFNSDDLNEEQKEIIKKALMLSNNNQEDNETEQ